MDSGARDLESIKLSGKPATRMTRVEAEAAPSSSAMDASAIWEHDADHPVRD